MVRLRRSTEELPRDDGSDAKDSGTDISAGAVLGRKEMSKSWVHVVFDEVVYTEHIFEPEARRVVNLSGNRPVPELRFP